MIRSASLLAVPALESGAERSDDSIVNCEERFSDTECFTLAPSTSIVTLGLRAMDAALPAAGQAHNQCQVPCHRHAVRRHRQEHLPSGGPQQASRDSAVRGCRGPRSRSAWPTWPPASRRVRRRPPPGPGSRGPWPASCG